MFTRIGKDHVNLKRSEGTRETRKFRIQQKGGSKKNESRGNQNTNGTERDTFTEKARRMM